MADRHQAELQRRVGRQRQPFGVGGDEGNAGRQQRARHGAQHAEAADDHVDLGVEQALRGRGRLLRVAGAVLDDQRRRRLAWPGLQRQQHAVAQVVAAPGVGPALRDDDADLHAAFGGAASASDAAAVAARPMNQETLLFAMRAPPEHGRILASAAPCGNLECPGAIDPTA